MFAIGRAEVTGSTVHYIRTDVSAAEDESETLARQRRTEGVVGTLINPNPTFGGSIVVLMAFHSICAVVSLIDENDASVVCAQRDEGREMAHAHCP